MRVIIANALKERIRRKELYIVVAIGILLILFLSSDSGSLTINGEPVTGFNNMFQVLHVLVNAIGVILAVVLSIRTIPNEYERKNSHLVWVRGIRQPVYHGSLTLANMFAAMFAVGILYLVLAVYTVINGHAAYLPRLIPAFLVLSVSVSMVSCFVSVLSIKLPEMVVGTIGALFAFAGIFHGLFDLFKSVLGGLGGKCMAVLLWMVPDLNEIQKQAYHLVVGKPVEGHIIWVGLFTIWIFSLGLFVFKKKEA